MKHGSCCYCGECGRDHDSCLCFLDNDEKIILHLCADIGSDSKPYKDAGYDVRLIGKSIGVENYHPKGEKIYGIIANPVCTEFSTARSNGKARDPELGMKLVVECQRIIKESNPVFWVIENPAKGVLNKYLGKPTMTYEPWHFGSPWSKKTALWGKFNKPEPMYSSKDWHNVIHKIPELYTRPGRSKPSLAFMHKSHKRFIREWDCFEVEDDMSFRSLCSQNFANAFFKENP